MTVRYVVLGGVASGAGTSVGTGLRLDYALSSAGPMVAGDELRICAGTYPIVYSGATGNQVNRFLANFATGTLAAPNLIVGANAAGVVDGTRPILQATGSYTGNTSMFSVGEIGVVTSKYTQWQNLDFDCNSIAYNAWNNAGQLAAGAGTDNNSYYHRFVSCRFRNSRHNAWSGFCGAAGSEVSFAHQFFGCSFESCGILNGGAGLYTRRNGGSTNFGSVWIQGCSFSGNQQAISISGNGVLPMAMIDTVVYGTTTLGMSISCGFQQVTGCVFANNSNLGGGLALTSNSYTEVSNCVFSGNADYGIVDDGWDFSTPRTNVPYWNNCIYGNGTAEMLDSFTVAGNMPGTGHIRSSPGFNSPANGDFSIAPGSPLALGGAWTPPGMPTGSGPAIGAGSPLLQGRTFRGTR